MTNKFSILTLVLSASVSLLAQQQTSNTDCQATGPNSVNCTTTTTTTPQHAPANTTPETSVPAQQIGHAAGTLLGSTIYQARLKRAINKACFDQHFDYWRFPNGQTITCADWMRAHPRKVKKSSQPSQLRDCCQPSMGCCHLELHMKCCHSKGGGV